MGCLNLALMKTESGLKINLGCGDGPIPGFVNVDALATARGVDVVADIAQPLPFPDGSARLIYASHLLEHFSTDEVPGLLRDWRRVLCEGGEVRIAVPNLEAIARLIVDREGWFTPPHAPWVAAIYGGQKDQYDFHRTGFTPVWLAHLLESAGFQNCRVVDRFEDIGKSDASYSVMPFGVNISLNMCAVAGASMGEAPRVTFVSRVLSPIDSGLCTALSVSTAIRSRLMMREKRRREERLAGSSR
jgi:predicted SAM-dependent methyltransferase